MTLTLSETQATLAELAIAVSVAVLAGWRGERPPDFSKGIRLVPWRLIMVTAAAASLLVLIHLLNLLGVETGRR